MYFKCCLMYMMKYFPHFPINSICILHTFVFIIFFMILSDYFICLSSVFYLSRIFWFSFKGCCLIIKSVCLFSILILLCFVLNLGFMCIFQINIHRHIYDINVVSVYERTIILSYFFIDINTFTNHQFSTFTNNQPHTNILIY